jgi:restriction system protein
MSDKKSDFKIWMVRSGSGGYLVEAFLANKIVAIGWNETGEINSDITYEGLKKLLSATYPDWSNGKLNQTAGQMWRFINQFNIGDKVITYDSSSREYYLGEIKSKYKFRDDFEYKHCREVNWDEVALPRDLLTTDTKNTLGSILTIFEVSNEILLELQKAHPGHMSDEELKDIEDAIQALEEQELAQLKEDVKFRSQEFIKDLVSNLSWQDTERLVSGLLRAMGYKTKKMRRTADEKTFLYLYKRKAGRQESFQTPHFL